MFGSLVKFGIMPSTMTFSSLYQSSLGRFKMDRYIAPTLMLFWHVNGWNESNRGVPRVIVKGGGDGSMGRDAAYARVQGVSIACNREGMLA